MDESQRMLGPDLCSGLIWGLLLVPLLVLLSPDFSLSPDTKSVDRWGETDPSDWTEPFLCAEGKGGATADVVVAVVVVVRGGGGGVVAVAGVGLKLVAVAVEEEVAEERRGDEGSGEGEE